MRRALILLMTVGAMLALVAGVAVAANVDCDGGLCEGTNRADDIDGSSVRDRIFAYDNPSGTFDNVDARGGPDEVHGDGGRDDIDGGSGADDLFGGRANDIMDSVDGVNGNDYIDCGKGNNDRAFADPGDVVVRCDTITRI